MTSNLLLWLIGFPLLASVVAPLLGVPLRRSRRAPYLLAHLGTLALALAALRDGPTSRPIAPLDAPFVLTLDRPAAVTLVLAALLFLAISAFSASFMGGARLGGTFLSLLLLEQAAANLVVLAGDLFALYAGLFFVSLSLTLMLGLDFARAGGAAALRLFATLEGPAALGLAAYWLIAGRAGTTVLADLPAKAAWLGSPDARVVVAPIAVALVCRAGLFPVQRWVVVGCRAAAAPAAAALAGLALPLGGLALARLMTAIPFAPSWMEAMAFLGAATAVVAGLGALREKTALGWLAYAAVAQAGFAAVGFAQGTTLGREAGWLALAGTAGVMTLTALGLGLAMRSSQQAGLVGPGQLPPNPIARIALAVGFLALAPLPPFPTFAARGLLLAGLLGAGSGADLLLALLVVGATILLAAAVWRPLLMLRADASRAVDDGNGHHAEAAVEETTAALAPAAGETLARAPVAASATVWGGRVYPPRASAPLPPGPARPPLPTVWSQMALETAGVTAWRPRAIEGGRLDVEVLAALGGLAILVGLAGLVPLGWLGALAGVSVVLPTFIPGILATILLAAGVGAALGLQHAWQEALERLADRRRMERRLGWLAGNRVVNVLVDPYLLIGSVLVGLGQLSAAVLNETLGRIARAG